jgi:hypothetical protein
MRNYEKIIPKGFFVDKDLKMEEYTILTPIKDLGDNCIIVSDDDKCIKIWSWDNAPDYLKNLSEHGGDEDWVAVLPPSYQEQYIPFLEDGSSFGYCEVSRHEHPRLKGYQVRIGAHA